MQTKSFSKYQLQYTGNAHVNLPIACVIKRYFGNRSMSSIIINEIIMMYIFFEVTVMGLYNVSTRTSKYSWIYSQTAQENHLYYSR